MIDDRFSAKSFETLGRNTPAAKSLAELLQDEIEQEIGGPVFTALRQIVARLNDMGHNLRLCDNDDPSNLAFRDDSGEPGTSTYHCRLRVAIDWVASSGYPHHVSADDWSLLDD